jgi:hypothetical protein
MKGIGLDCGTFNTIRCDATGIDINRNVFLTIPNGVTSERQLKKMNLPFVKIDGELHLLGQDALNFSNVFPGQQLRRPQASGLLNPSEQSAFPILKHSIGKLIGATDSKEIVVYSVPGPSIDGERQVDFHRDVLRDIIEFFGFKAVPVNESVLLANVGLKDDNFTGLAASFGAGQLNLTLQYRGLSALQFAVNKGGDWVTSQVSQETGLPFAKANRIKETEDFSVSPYSDEKRNREQQAVKSYLEALVRYLLANIKAQFYAKEDIPVFEDPVPFVLGGGGCQKSGFLDLFREELKHSDFPIEISEVKYVEEPLTAVARGAYMEAQQLEEEE